MSATALPLLARLGEAASYPAGVRGYETDPWSYMRRKLDDCGGPLRDYKRSLYEQAAARLLEDLREPFLKPGALMDHKETFEKLLTPDVFADLSFHLDPGGDPAARREAVKDLLTGGKVKTLFDTETLPPERRGKPWQTMVADAAGRLELDRLKAMLDRAPRNERRRAYIVRRARRNFAEFMTVTRSETGMREEITLFVLTRVEAAVAALLRFLNA
ncbi:MAG: hypothetical protein Q8T11_16060 [Elusimicrobiota bacterium]|nr:hypothetical protein [Elusimicrobiota bacterium]